MNAAEITSLLAVRHSKDLFVPECKTGPTPCPTLDAWAMVRSWAHPTTHGYEIKVSRSDWLGDHKWEKYLDTSTYFWIVSPRGVVQKEEVPDGVGLLYVASTGSRFVTQRKAARRNVDVPHTGIAQYLLQSRVRIDPERGKTREERIAEWRTWLDTRKDACGIGYRVGNKVREAIETANRERDEAIHKVEAVEQVLKVCEELGIDTSRSWDVESRARKVLAGETDAVLATLRGVHNKIDVAIRALSAAIGRPV